MPPSHADANQTLQRSFDETRDTFRTDALLWYTTDGGTTWLPVPSVLGSGGIVQSRLHYWNGSTWVPWGGASRKETEFALIALATEAAI